MVEKGTDMPKADEDKKSDTRTTSTERTQEAISDRDVENQEDKMAGLMKSEDMAPKSPEAKSENLPILTSLSGERTDVEGRALCNVENCDAVLSEERYYYQRYKICRKHLRSSKLVVDGQPQRFCQQCGRFHDLAAFDGEKRNCRFRLEKHNSRRRKLAAEYMESAEKEENKSKSKRMTNSGVADLNGNFAPGHFGSIPIPRLDQRGDTHPHLKVEQQQQEIPFGLNNDQALLGILTMYYNSADREMLFPRDFVMAMDSIEKSFGIQVIKDILHNHMSASKGNAHAFPGYNPASSFGQHPYYDPRASMVSQLQHLAGYGMAGQAGMNRPMAHDYRVPAMAPNRPNFNLGGLASLLARQAGVNSQNQMTPDARTVSSQPTNHYQGYQNNDAVDAGRHVPSGLDSLLRALQSRETGDGK
jgi:hypothetical protein